MNTIMIWMLISISYGNNNFGTTTVVGHFKTQQMCENVMNNLPFKNGGNIKANCIQAEIVVTK